MTVLGWIFNNRRLVLTVAALLSLSGVAMWLTMVRQEDPRLPAYWGQVVAPYPGADAPLVERLVLEPIEDALAEVHEIRYFEATAFDEMAVLEIELRGDIRDFNAAWDEVREALAQARLDFPEGAGRPVLDENQVDQDAIVLAVCGSADSLELLQGARHLKDRLLGHPLVKRAEIIADPGEQVTIALNDDVARRLGLNTQQLASQLGARSRILSGGSLQMEGKSIRLRPLSEFASVAEIQQTPIRLSGGQSVPLSEVARVHLSPREPARARMRIDGAMAVGVGVVPREAINIVRFGDEVRRAIADAAPAIEPLRVQVVTYQPARTQTRLSELNRSLLFGVMIVAGTLIMAMGIRLGLLVASVVPLVTMTAVALYAWGGGVLHQISIAALVLALGMLVDNAIVVAENVQWRLDRGQSPRAAAMDAVKELAVPLAGATLTTLAAFIPMLISQGPTADFTRTIPVIIMLTLAISYLYALAVTPLLSHMTLRPSHAPRRSLLTDLGRGAAALAIKRPVAVLVVAGMVLVGVMALSRQVPRQFFPSADRNQILVDVKLVEGAHIDATDATVLAVEKALAGHTAVHRVASFVGRGAPAFYYNVQRVPFSPHFAQLIVETVRADANDAVLHFIRSALAPALPEAELVVRKLEQGPPVDAPIEIRLQGQHLEHLEQAAVAVIQRLKSLPAARDIRHDLGPGAPTLRFRIDDAVAGRYGISRVDVGHAIYGRTRGTPVGELYSREDPIPVVIRSAAGERMAISDLEAIDVPTTTGQVVPLAQVAHIEPLWQPAAIRHRNGQRVVTVSAQLAEGSSFSGVLADLERRLATLRLPQGVALDFGGDAEGSGEANRALLSRMPIGLLVLLGVLLAEFNSFRRTAIILMTIPLATAGVVPGLLVGQQPFGFMSLLGVIALIGIVVNNAIVLLEVVESRRRQGADIPQALTDAVARRIRPIVLTTATTVAGLLPLAFSASTLWPPLALAMISGLLASTLLTLVVVPALYRVLMDSRAILWLAGAGRSCRKLTPSRS